MWLDLKQVLRETGQSLLEKVPQNSNVEVLVPGKDHNKDLKVLILYHGVSVSGLSPLLISILTLEIPCLTYCG